MDKLVVVVFKLVPEALYILDEQIKKEVFDHCNSTNFPWCDRLETVELLTR
jgi:hypothetical protein